MEMALYILTSFIDSSDYIKGCYANTILDISSNNILQGIEDNSILSQIEEDAIKKPIARKVLSDRHIYYSQQIPVCTGLPCSLTWARQ
jgi:hypothetical protein